MLDGRPESGRTGSRGWSTEAVGVGGAEIRLERIGIVEGTTILSICHAVVERADRVALESRRR